MASSVKRIITGNSMKFFFFKKMETTKGISKYENISEILIMISTFSSKYIVNFNKKLCDNICIVYVTNPEFCPAFSQVISTFKNSAV